MTRVNRHVIDAIGGAAIITVEGIPTTVAGEPASVAVRRDATVATDAVYVRLANGTWAAIGAGGGGGGGNLSGTLTSGRVPVATGANSLGDSNLVAAGATLAMAGEIRTQGGSAAFWADDRANGVGQSFALYTTGNVFQIFSAAAGANRLSLTNAGLLTAVQFAGSGAGLTNVPFAALTSVPDFARRDTANTFAGEATFTPLVRLSGSTAQFRGVQIQTGGSPRWFLYANANAETGSNLGSEFRLARYSDAGSYINDVMIADRSTGNITWTGIGLYPLNAEGLRVGGIRGQFSGTGTSDDNGLQLYSNVTIGDPSGWGAPFTAGVVPTRGLSVWGGLRVGYGNGAGATISGVLTVANGAQTLNLQETGSTNHAYLAFLSNVGTRKAYIGFAGSGDTTVALANEVGGGFSFFAGGSQRFGVGSAGANANRYNDLSGNRMLEDNGTYTLICDASARDAIYLGGTGDPNNYYDNGSHLFRNRAGSPAMILETAASYTSLAFRAGAGGTTLAYVWADGNGGGFLNRNGQWAFRMDAGARINQHFADEHRFRNNADTATIMSLQTVAATITAGGVTTTFNTAGVTSADFVLSSDARLKQDIRRLDGALERLRHVRGYTYTRRGQREVGVLAQELLTALPSAVSRDADGYFAVAYDRLVPLLIEAVHELAAQLEARPA